MVGIEVCIPIWWSKSLLLRTCQAPGTLPHIICIFPGVCVCDIQAAWGIQSNFLSPHPGVEDVRRKPVENSYPALFKGSKSTEASEATEKQVSVVENRRKREYYTSLAFMNIWLAEFSKSVVFPWLDITFSAKFHTKTTNQKPLHRKYQMQQHKQQHGWCLDLNKNHENHQRFVFTNNILK